VVEEAQIWSRVGTGGWRRRGTPSRPTRRTPRGRRWRSAPWPPARRPGCAGGGPPGRSPRWPGTRACPTPGYPGHPVRPRPHRHRTRATSDVSGSLPTGREQGPAGPLSSRPGRRRWRWRRTRRPPADLGEWQVGEGHPPVRRDRPVDGRRGRLEQGRRQPLDTSRLRMLTARAVWTVRAIERTRLSRLTRETGRSTA